MIKFADHHAEIKHEISTILSTLRMMDRGFEFAELNNMSSESIDAARIEYTRLEERYEYLLEMDYEYTRDAYNDQL